jgi:serine/threonine-protein phosphatase 2A activator
MIKMYNAEVLSKFPVVQHFPFGSLFTWEKVPEAAAIASTIHAKSQPRQQNTLPSRYAIPPPTTSIPSRPGPPMEGTKAPRASAGTSMPSTARLPAVPDGRAGPLGGMPPPGPRGLPTTRAPWATGASRAPPPAPSSGGTAAPWARNVPTTPRPPPGMQDTKEGKKGDE